MKNGKEGIAKSCKEQFEAAVCMITAENKKNSPVPPVSGQVENIHFFSIFICIWLKKKLYFKGAFSHIG